jgi:glycosyltransferase involved in cell wall biosynthesis
VHFKIIIPLYNVEKWISTNLASILGQEHKDYEAIIINDCSTDNTLEIVENMVGTDSRFVIKDNIDKCFALKNIAQGIALLEPHDEDTIILVDGDDWLKDKHVLSKVQKVYEEKKCLVTYGSYMTYPGGKSAWNVSKYPPNVIDNSSYRNDPQWRASHLRTFKYGVWKNVKDEDLKDSKGEYFRMAWDLAIMFPVLEMAAHKQEFISDALYVYNRSNPLNDDKINHQLQLRQDQEIRLKKKYAAL